MRKYFLKFYELHRVAVLYAPNGNDEKTQKVNKGVPQVDEKVKVTIYNNYTI